MQMRQAVQAAPSKPLPPAKPRRMIRPWSPSTVGPYRLPKPILDRLVAALATYKNREAALGLAVFIGRFWSTPNRLVAAFPIDRRALADHTVLSLSEARVRGALATLEAVGFLDRDMVPDGSRYRPTEHGLHRKPVLWRFGEGYREAFAKANGRAQTNRTSSTPSRRPIVSTPGPKMVLPKPEMPPVQLAQKQIQAESVIMGEENPAPLTSLDAALERLKRAIGGADGGAIAPERPADAIP